MEDLVSSRGGEALYRPLCSVSSGRGGIALYCPLCSVLYRIAGRRGRPFPVPGVPLYIPRGRTALYSPLCSVLNLWGGRLSTVPRVWLFVGVTVAFSKGDGVRSSSPYRERRS